LLKISKDFWIVKKITIINTTTTLRIIFSSLKEKATIMLLNYIIEIKKINATIN